jgi:long-chain acyl-CoA synthetase
MYPGNYAESKPNSPAVIMAGTGEVMSFAELNARSNQLAHRFRAAGLTRGDHVALFMENQIHFMEVVWAAMRSGLYLTAINSYLTPGEVSYIVEDCGAGAFITSKAKTEIVTQVEFPDQVTTRLMIGGTAPGFDSYEDAIAQFPETNIADESMGTLMLYSSGTTGRPKGVKRVLPTVVPSEIDPGIAHFKTLYDFRDDMVYLSPAPMYHAAPLAYSLWAHQYGGTVVIMERFDPMEALALIERYHVTHSQWVPTMFVRMLKLSDEERQRHDLSSLEVAIHAAAPCPVPVKHQMIEWWGPKLFEYYAGTEGNGSTIINSHEWLQKPGSVGRSSVAKLHILDEEFNELPAGSEGTIWFSGGGDFEYHNAPEKNAESHRTGGLSTLGDVGYVDEDGYLFLTDRKAYMIIAGGVNIYPREIEDILVTHPAVADVAVFGIPNDDLGEEVKAVVQPVDMSAAGPELAAELLAFCGQHLARFKVPRTLDFEAELPRLPTGKLYKRILRDRYMGKADTTIV